MGESGDRYEREADRIADQVVTGQPTLPRAPVPVTPLVQRQEEDEDEEELLQPKTDGARSISPDHAPLRTAASAVSSGGRPLSPPLRAYFEPRFGRDLSAVRLHNSARAGAAARSIRARAYTLGSNIAFAPGQYAPQTDAGRRLMAHEITHTLQQGMSAPLTVQREPDAAADLVPSEDIFVVFGPQIMDPPEPDGFAAIGGKVEASGPFFPGDILHARVDVEPRILSQDVKWVTVGGGLEVAGRIDPTTVLLRILENVGDQAQSGFAEATISSPEFVENIQVKIRVAPLPEAPDLLDPEAVENEEQIAEARASRKALKSEFRALSRDEKKEQRKAFRAEKRALRGDLRQLRAERRGIRKSSSCSLDRQRQIEAAVALGAQRAGAAVAKVSPGSEPGEAVKAALSRFFRLSATPENADRVNSTLQRIVDVLNLARNSMIVSDRTDYICGSLKCDEVSGALVTVLQRGQSVTVCHKWLNGTARFEVVNQADDARAYALLHEFIHMSGITTGQDADGKEADELYVHSDGWRKLDASDALEMADAYAAFAWTLGSGGGPSGGEDK